MRVLPSHLLRTPVDTFRSVYLGTPVSGVSGHTGGGSTDLVGGKITPPTDCCTVLEERTESVATWYPSLASVDAA